MSDITTTQAETAGGGSLVSGLRGLAEAARRGDIGLALAVIGIIVVLILPMPAFMLDMSLAISIIFAVLILMTALFIHTPLEFSSFPTILLIATMLRLALNLASTRLILSHGHEGTDAAGAVIQAFGNFVMQGNFIIGLIVFSILVLVNFVVITKGSGRIAEVAARFTLDAMPGKQMAIDADLSSGLIDEDEARKRRRNLEDEASFFGAMDGASKFVRGDAIAGLLITFINIIGGMVIGIGQMNLTMAEAGRTYTLLTIGDGLVSQIPALVVSTAAGLLVSKAGVTGAADKALSDQLSHYPKALGMSALVMVVMALLPGIPFVPFMTLGTGAGFLAWRLHRRKKDEADSAALPTPAGTKGGAAAPGAHGAPGASEPPAEDPIESALKMDDLRIEIGYNLLPLINKATDGADQLTEQIKALRRQLATELGFVMPPVRLLDNMRISANDYVIKVKEVDGGQGTLYVDQLMVMDPAGNQIQLPGTHTTEPTFGLPATWIEATLRDKAEMRGYTVVDPATVLATHLTEVIKANVSELLSYAVVSSLLHGLSGDHKKLVDDIVPSQISVSGIQRVLQHLLDERVSIRDLPTILEGIAEAAGALRTPSAITEHVRSRLARQLCAQHQSPNGYLPLLTLSPKWEQVFLESIVGEGEDRQLAMAPSLIQEFMQNVRDGFESAAQVGEIPVLLTSSNARPFVRSLVERFRSQSTVMAQSEIHPRARLKTIGTV